MFSGVGDDACICIKHANTARAPLVSLSFMALPARQGFFMHMGVPPLFLL